MTISEGVRIVALRSGTVARYWGLAAALTAGAALMFAPPPARPPAPPISATLAWPNAQRESVPADLPDGTAYEPGLFLDARTSVGTAPSRDGRYLRMLVRHADGTVKQLRQLPMRDNPSVESLTSAGDVLVWMENVNGRQQLWTVDLRDSRPPRLVTADTGDARFYESQYDLAIVDGRVRWAAAGDGDSTQIRSVALTGGPVETSTEQGTWELTAWPWLSNGVVAASGTTMLKNAVTSQSRTVPVTPRGVTDCTPTWCQVTSLTADGSTRVSLVHPDGTGHRDIAVGTAQTVIADVAVLDRFEVLAQLSSTTALTGNVEVLVYEIATRRTVQVSLDATNVSYRGGVLWWSTGNQDAFLRHSLDLRTV